MKKKLFVYFLCCFLPFIISGTAVSAPSGNYDFKTLGGSEYYSNEGQSGKGTVNNTCSYANACSALDFAQGKPRCKDIQAQNQHNLIGWTGGWSGCAVGCSTPDEGGLTYKFTSTAPSGKIYRIYINFNGKNSCLAQNCGDMGLPDATYGYCILPQARAYASFNNSSWFKETYLPTNSLGSLDLKIPDDFSTASSITVYTKVKFKPEYYTRDDHYFIYGVNAFFYTDDTSPTVTVSGNTTNWVNTVQTATVNCSDGQSGCSSSTYRLREQTGTCSTTYSNYTLTSPQTVFWWTPLSRQKMG